jgi:hypothetical protein
LLRIMVIMVYKLLINKEFLIQLSDLTIASHCDADGLRRRPWRWPPWPLMDLWAESYATVQASAPR